MRKRLALCGVIGDRGSDRIITAAEGWRSAAHIVKATRRAGLHEQVRSVVLGCSHNFCCIHFPFLGVLFDAQMITPLIKLDQRRR